MRRLILLSVFGALLAGLWSPSGARAAPRIVVTIGPIHSLVAAVTEGVAAPELIMRGAASPHSFAIRPSQARSLQSADVIVRVGESLEVSLDRPIEALGKQARVITLDQVEGMTLLPAREGGIWESHDHGDSGDEHGTEEDGGGVHVHAKDHGRDGAHNPHIWLNPRNAIVAVDRISQVLSEMDPKNAPRYQANAEREKAKLAALDAELAAQTESLRAKPYLVFHDAYRYFENRYRLMPVGAITVSPARQPGAKRLAEIRAKIRELGAVCVFSEPQFEPKLVGTIIEGTGSKSGVLDPLGADLEPGPDLYFTLMRNLVDGLDSCLKTS